MIDQRRIDRMAGCACLGKAILIPVGLLFLGALLLAFVSGRSPICITPIEPRLTRATVGAVEEGIVRFHKVHHRLPVSLALLNGGGRVRVQGPWLEELLRLPSLDGGSTFLELQQAKAGLAGMVKTKEGWAVADAWGEICYLTLSGAADLPKDPESSAAKNAGITASVPSPNVGILVYSAGPDRDPATWDDNIRSAEIARQPLGKREQ
ncbi:MAG: hypothetical protein ACO1TE_20290 [Prosthecobacter sp.]